MSSSPHSSSHPLAIGCALLAILGLFPASSAYGASEANNLLFGGSNAHSGTSNSHTGATTTGRSAAPPANTTPASARPQGAGTIRTSTAVTRTQATPGFSLPHIATTTPQSTPQSTPARTQRLGLPGSAATPNVPTTPTGAATTPSGIGAAPGIQTAPTTGRPVALRATSAKRTSLSPVAIVAAVLAVLLILVCCIWGMVRWYAYEPHWTLSLRHSFGEAGLRMSSTWEELLDWARLGR